VRNVITVVEIRGESTLLSASCHHPSDIAHRESEVLLGMAVCQYSEQICRGTSLKCSAPASPDRDCFSFVLAFVGVDLRPSPTLAMMQPPIPAPISSIPAAPEPSAASAAADPAVPTQTVETGHADTVHDAQLDFYGRRLATCSSDRTIRIFDVDTSGSRALVTTLEGHDGPVWQVAWAHPTRHGRPILASCGFDGRVILWIEDSPGGQWRVYYDYAWHASSVNSVCFAPHEYGLIFACASSDGYVSVCEQQSDGSWNERRVSESRDGGAHTHSLGANSVSWAPAVAPGGLWMPEMAAPPQKRIVTAGCDQLIKVWKCDEANSNWVLDGPPLSGHREMVRSVAWAPSIGLPRAIIASAGQDKRVIVWSREHASPSATAGAAAPTAADWTKVELPLFASPVWSVNWSPTGSALGVACGDETVSIWKEELDGTYHEIAMPT
jgi:protein transport protein SEC13